MQTWRDFLKCLKNFTNLQTSAIRHFHVHVGKNICFGYCLTVAIIDGLLHIKYLHKGLNPQCAANHFAQKLSFIPKQLNRFLDAGNRDRNFKELLRNKLRFTWGGAEVLPMAPIFQILNWASWPELFSRRMHRGARPTLSLGWHELRLNSRTQNDWKFCLRMTMRRVWEASSTYSSSSAHSTSSLAWQS